MHSFKLLAISFALSLLLVAPSLVSSAMTTSCTYNLDGMGDIDAGVTKDCCAATRTHRTTGFNELDHKCEDALGLGNGIDFTRFEACCKSRGRGAHNGASD